MFDQQLLRANNKDNIKPSVTSWFLHQGPTMQKVPLCHDVNMVWGTNSLSSFSIIPFMLALEATVNYLFHREKWVSFATYFSKYIFISENKTINNLCILTIDLPRTIWLSKSQGPLNSPLSNEPLNLAAKKTELTHVLWNCTNRMTKPPKRYLYVTGRMHAATALNG